MLDIEIQSISCHYSGILRNNSAVRKFFSIETGRFIDLTLAILEGTVC